MLLLPSKNAVYTSKDAKKLFIKRNELIADLNICEALHQENSDSNEPELAKFIRVLRCRISIIDSLFSIINYTELFVIQSRLIHGMDWPQIATRYNQSWGKEDGLSIRALQLRLKSGIAKATRAMNQRSKVPWGEILDAPSCWSSTDSHEFHPLEQD